MRVLAVIDEDFDNYKKPAMFIGTISCGGKCCVEAGLPLSICQNDRWRNTPPVLIDDSELCKRYLNNKVTQAIVFGGLEPFEQFEEMKCLIRTLRNNYRCKDDVVIYTGYMEEELLLMIDELSQFENIIIKFGRFVPNKEHVYDDTLGVYLASDNQFAKRIS